MTIKTRACNFIATVSLILPTLFVLSIPFSSCSKEAEHETENHCPVVTASAVPQVVKDSFSIRYPSMEVKTWFMKDNLGYCAYFIEPVNQKKLAEFTTTGNFISEETDIDNDGNFEDATSDSSVKISTSCECEIPE